MIKNLYSGQDNIKDHFYSIILFSITNFPFTFQSCDNQLIFDPKMCTFWLVIFSLKIKHEYIIASGLSGLANLGIGHQVPHLIRIYTKKEIRFSYDASFTHQRSSQDERSHLSFTLCVNILNFREAISWNLSR